MVRTDTQDNAIFAVRFMGCTPPAIPPSRGAEDTAGISDVKRESGTRSLAILVRGENPDSDE